MSVTDKEIMQRLRQERAAQVAAAKERIKRQAADLKLIRQHLGSGPATVPQIAGATGLNPAQVLWYLAAMRKYGQASEGDKQAGYFTYALAADTPAADGEPS